MKRRNRCLLPIFITLIFLSTFLSATGFKEQISYTPIKEKSLIHGMLAASGSIQAGKLLKIWLAGFQKIYPRVESRSSFKGSSSGIEALLDGRCNIAISSRPIRVKEIQSFRRLKGYAPTELKVSLGAIAIYVNKLNRLESITLQELDAIFSKERKRGYPKEIKSWQDLGVEKKSSIEIYRLNQNSGIREYFQKKVMLNGEYKELNASSEFSTTEELTAHVAEHDNSITFGNIGIENLKVKSLKVAQKSLFPSYAPSIDNIVNGRYPLTRYYYLYFDISETRMLPPLLYEFTRYILSSDGQKSVYKIDGIALDPQTIGSQLSKLHNQE